MSYYTQCLNCLKRDNSSPTKDSELPVINTEKKSKKNYAIIEKGRIKKDEFVLDDPNHQFYMSYGKNNMPGNFYFECSDDRCKYDMLTDICNQGDYYFKKYALVEKKTTQYYKLIFDLDFHTSHDDYEKYVNSSAEIVKLIISTIDIVLQELFVKPDKKYLYCDKSEGGGAGIHLYYPSIIINKIFHCHIYNNVLNRLINSKKFGLTDKMWMNIFDGCVSGANSLRLPYFNVNNSFYKQNKEMSTVDVPEYDGNPNPNVLKMCCIRTNYSTLQPKPLIEIFQNDIIIKKNKSTNISKTNKTNLMKTNAPINKISIINLDKLLQCINIDRFLKYVSWFALKFVVYNCNNSIDACKLFHKYCAIGSYKYITYQEIEKEFMNTKTVPNFDVNVLKCYSRKDNLKLYNSLDLDVKYDPQNFKTTEFTRPKISQIKGEKNISMIRWNEKIFKK
jgi:hypothetical protein